MAGARLGFCGTLRQRGEVALGPGNRLADQRLDGGERALVGPARERESAARAASAAGPADPVDVILGMMRHVEIEDVAHRRNVEATRGDIARHQDRDLAGAEAVERQRAGALVHVAVERRDVEAVARQRLLQQRHVALAVAEDEGVVEIDLAPDEPAQYVAFLVPLRPYRHELLHDGGGGRGRARHLDPLRVVQEDVGEPLDLGRHGGGEEQGLAREGDHLHDALDVGDEPHVEHAVGLVDHEELDAGEQELAALEMVEQAAGRGDQHVGAAHQLGVLVTEGDAADDQSHVELVVGAVAVEVLDDLGGELAGRLEDQRARHPCAGAPILQERQHRQGEGGGLAGAGLGDAEHVAAGEHMRDGLGLDRRRLGVAGRGDGLEDLVAQSEVGKGHIVQKNRCAREMAKDRRGGQRHGRRRNGLAWMTGSRQPPRRRVAWTLRALSECVNRRPRRRAALSAALRTHIPRDGLQAWCRLFSRTGRDRARGLVVSRRIQGRHPAPDRMLPSLCETFRALSCRHSDPRKHSAHIRRRSRFMSWLS